MYILGMQRLVIVRGPEYSGKAELARAIAERLGGPAVALHFADLLDRWIVEHRADAVAEVDLCYRLLKLLAVTYLKEGYSLVVDAPYVHALPVPENRRATMDELIMLARTFRGLRPAVVTVLPGLLETAELEGVVGHDHLDGEIRIEGTGENVTDIANRIVDRIGMQ